MKGGMEWQKVEAPDKLNPYFWVPLGRNSNKNKMKRREEKKKKNKGYDLHFITLYIFFFFWSFSSYKHFSICFLHHRTFATESEKKKKKKNCPNVQR